MTEDLEMIARIEASLAKSAEARRIRAAEFQDAFDRRFSTDTPTPGLAEEYEAALVERGERAAAAAMHFSDERAYYDEIAPRPPWISPRGVWRADQHPYGYTERESEENSA